MSPVQSGLIVSAQCKKSTQIASSLSLFADREHCLGTKNAIPSSSLSLKSTNSSDLDGAARTKHGSVQVGWMAKRVSGLFEA